MIILLVWDGSFKDGTALLRKVIGPFPTHKDARHWAENSVYDYWTVRTMNLPR